jgi:hypothetical protein
MIRKELEDLEILKIIINTRINKNKNRITELSRDKIDEFNEEFQLNLKI